MDVWVGDGRFFPTTSQVFHQVHERPVIQARGRIARKGEGQPRDADQSLRVPHPGPPLRLWVLWESSSVGVVLRSDYLVVLVLLADKTTQSRAGMWGVVTTAIAS